MTPTAVLPDSLVQKYRPVVMVPRQVALDPCPAGDMRFLMAEDGLYLDARTPWGVLTMRLWQSPVPLPYGPVETVDTFQDMMPSITRIIATQMIPHMVENASAGEEWFGTVTWDGKKPVYSPMPFTATKSSIQYTLALPHGHSLMAEVHSHGLGYPGFSPTDDHDDLNGIKISAVVGKCIPDADTYPATWRYCVERFTFNESKGEICRKKK